MDNYIPQLQTYIKADKISDAKSLLEQLSTKADAQKGEVLQMLALASDKTALELLSFLTQKSEQIPQIHDRLIQLITDRAHINSRFVLILLDNTDAATILRTVPLLKHILNKETDIDVLNKIIRTAGKLKIEKMVAIIAEFMFYDNDEFKNEAVKALERIGTSLALEKLIKASKTSKCDQNILDAIEVLEDKYSQSQSTEDKLRQDSDESAVKIDQLVSQNIQKRFEALDYFSDQGPNAVLSLFNQLKQKDLNKNLDLTLNIMRLIARTIPLGTVDDLFDIINQKGIDNTIKFSAYSALEAFPELESAALLVNGISESALFVRLAALKALDKNLSDFVGSEIKSQIESGTKKGESLALSILDARAKNIIEFLMVSDAFYYMASNYLERTASLQVLDAFIEILEKRGLKSTARKYMDLRTTKTSQQKKQIMVISSSEAILDIYSKLTYACGFTNICFRQSQDAFESIVSEKPDAIICDLILNDMTGLDLTREIREIYSINEMPIILSTLQRDLNKKQLQKLADDSGVNAIFEFPVKQTQMKKQLNAQIKNNVKP